MPANPVRCTLVAVIRKCKARLLHQVVIKLQNIRNRVGGITHRQVNARWIRVSTLRDNEERPAVVREKRIGIRITIIEILIMDRILAVSYTHLRAHETPE